MSVIVGNLSETILLYWNRGRNKKITPSGWISGNAPCCVHNGTTPDHRGRGGLFVDDESVIFSCFNCKFKAVWNKGNRLTYNMRRLLEWIGTPDDAISKLAIELLRQSEDTSIKTTKLTLPIFQQTALPPDAELISKWSSDNKYIIKLREYMLKRNLSDDDYPFYWSPNVKFRNRLIIPFLHNNNIVGYTARDITGKNTNKYISEQQPGYLFNIDNQRNYNKVFCIVTEGPIDAIHIEGAALLGSSVREEQILQLRMLDKEIIVVPDRDKSGKDLIEVAIDNGWSVSMPDWHSDINDIDDAVKQYGKLFTLYSIVSSSEKSPLKIKLKEKKWFG